MEKLENSADNKASGCLSPNETPAEMHLDMTNHLPPTEENAGAPHARTFTLFPKLAAEIQLRVWKEAAVQPEALAPHYHHSRSAVSGPFADRRPRRSLHNACFASRSAVKRYSVLMMMPGGDKGAWFNPDRDVLVYLPYHPGCFATVCASIYYSEDMRNLVQRLACEGPIGKDRGWRDWLDVVTGIWPNVRTLHLIVNPSDIAKAKGRWAMLRAAAREGWAEEAEREHDNWQKAEKERRDRVKQPPAALRKLEVVILMPAEYLDRVALADVRIWGGGVMWRAKTGTSEDIILD